MSDDLSQLGQAAAIPASPDEARLERVANPHPDVDYVARFTAPEFTSICPVTGQPDFAHLVIDYVPGEWIVESKSLKLYLTAFRNHGAFHEDCTDPIAKRLVDLLAPKWLRIGGYWYPRGGIPIDVFWQTGEAPAGVWIPDQGVAPYRGRAADARPRHPCAMWRNVPLRRRGIIFAHGNAPRSRACSAPPWACCAADPG